MRLNSKWQNNKFHFRFISFHQKRIEFIYSLGAQTRIKQTLFIGTVLMSASWLRYIIISHYHLLFNAFVNRMNKLYDIEYVLIRNQRQHRQWTTFSLDSSNETNENGKDELLALNATANWLSKFELLSLKSFVLDKTNWPNFTSNHPLFKIQQNNNAPME